MSGVYVKGPRFHSKSSGDCGGGGGFQITRPTRREKMFRADVAIYVYSDGRVEIGKDRNGDHGSADIEKAVLHFSRILANLKLKDTNLDMFKEGLAEMLSEEMNKVLEGNHYERTICSESTRNGSNNDRGT